MSIWGTERARPKVVVKNVFEQGVLDLSWSPDGLSLLTCSTDGTAAFFQLSNEEVGHCLFPNIISVLLSLYVWVGC